MSEELHPLPDWPMFRQTASESPSPASPPAGAAVLSQGKGSGFLPSINTSPSAMDRRSENMTTKLADVLNEIWGWGGSFGMHCLFLLIAALTIQQTADTQQKPPQIDSVFFDPDEETTLPELTQVKDIWNTNIDAPIAFTPTKTVTETVKHLNADRDPMDEIIREEVLEAEPAFSPPMEETDLSEVVEGVQGTIVNTVGDTGSVDRITLEIVNRLKKNKVVVVWLMDASESLQMRRQQIIERFDRVYVELDDLARDRKDALLTSVVAFGQKTSFMTSSPTADRNEIKQAVRDIPVDESGIENVFSAISAVALHHHKHTIKGYQVMIVVLTDESGNDPAKLDNAIRQVKRDKIPVYVIGPLAPFARSEVRVKWTDSQTDEEFFLPVDRGPESAVIEYPVLPHWHARTRSSILSSGFGSFGLVRIARDSAGIYFLHNDGDVAGPQFDDAGMLDYAPDYVDAAEYQRRIGKQPLRKAILQVVTASRQSSPPQPQTKFLAAGIQFVIRDCQRPLTKTYKFLDRAVNRLQAVEKFRDSENSSRWQAHYELLMGQLLLRRVLLARSIPLLNDMYTKPKPCTDVTCNAWELSGIPGTSLSGTSQTQTENSSPAAGANGAAASKKSGKEDRPKSDTAPEPTTAERDSSERRDLEVARRYLERVVDRHPGTPWSFLAQAELESPLEFEWKQGFMIPPEGEKLPWEKPPGEWKELSEEDRAKLKSAKERFERFRKERQKKKVLKQKQTEERAQKKRNIPKL